MFPTTDHPLKCRENPVIPANRHLYMSGGNIVSNFSHSPTLLFPFHMAVWPCHVWSPVADTGFVLQTVPNHLCCTHSPVCRRRYRTWPDSIKPIGWQEQEGALWPSHPSPMPAVLPGARRCSAKASPDGAVLYPSCGAAHVFRVILLLTRNYVAGAPSFLLQLQCQGKHGGAEKEKSPKLCSCLPTNVGLRRNWFWFHVETQSNITESRYFSRLTLVYFSLAIMIHTKLLKMFQGPALWSLPYLIFLNCYQMSKADFTMNQNDQKSEKTFSKEF